eukprot:1271037-Amphidinium_carterae.1
MHKKWRCTHLHVFLTGRSTADQCFLDNLSKLSHHQAAPTDPHMYKAVAKTMTCVACHGIIAGSHVTL